MNEMTKQVRERGAHRRARVWLAILAVSLSTLTVGCGTLMMLMHGHPMAFEIGDKPADAAEYGFARRPSRTGLYRLSADAPQPIRVGRMHAMRLRVETADGCAVDGATITVDGGMPEHGHGLPTHPEVTAALGDGFYEIEGLKYNMGGWWVVRVRVDGPGGADEVVFHLDL